MEVFSFDCRASDVWFVDLIFFCRVEQPSVFTTLKDVVRHKPMDPLNGVTVRVSIEF